MGTPPLHELPNKAGNATTTLRSLCRGMGANDNSRKTQPRLRGNCFHVYVRNNVSVRSRMRPSESPSSEEVNAQAGYPPKYQRFRQLNGTPGTLN